MSRHLPESNDHLDIDICLNLMTIRTSPNAWDDENYTSLAGCEPSPAKVDPLVELFQDLVNPSSLPLQQLVADEPREPVADELAFCFDLSLFFVELTRAGI